MIRHGAEGYVMNQLDFLKFPWLCGKEFQDGDVDPEAPSPTVTANLGKSALEHHHCHLSAQYRPRHEIHCLLKGCVKAWLGAHSGSHQVPQKAQLPSAADCHGDSCPVNTSCKPGSTTEV